MSMIRLKVVVTALALLLGTSVGVWAYQASGPQEEGPSQNGASAEGDPTARAQDIELPGRLAAKSAEGPPEKARSRDARDGREPKSDAIDAALDKPIPIQFPNETALDDVLRFIKEATKGPDLPNGIPIYVDPFGLQEAEQTMKSPIQLDLEGVALRTTLTLLLKQLGLVYEIKDGELMIITYGQDFTDLTPLEEMWRKAEQGELSLEQMQTLIEQMRALVELRKLQLELEKTGYPAGVVDGFQ